VFSFLARRNLYSTAFPEKVAVSSRLLHTWTEMPGEISTRIQLGIDRFLVKPEFWRHLQRVGLVTNDAARTGSDSAKAGRLALLEAGIPLARIFVPEHGLTGRAPDGASVADSKDPLTGLPAVSLYGPRLEPDHEATADLDAIVFDLQDIGIRFYTFIWTLFHLMDVCRRTRCRLLVLDRPTPLGGGPDRAEGPLLDPARCGSFLGRSPIPLRHGLTPGELACHWQRRHFPELNLQVIKMEGWDQRPSWATTGLPFHPPSPGIPNLGSASLYGATAFFEATNLSVARGTDLAFQAVGAPWFRSAETADCFNAAQLAGVRAEPVEFQPTDPPHAKTTCQGIRLMVTAEGGFRPVASGLRLLASVIAIHRDRFTWANYPTAANPTGMEHFEKLVGTVGIREYLDREAENISGAQIAQWTSAGDWAAHAAPSLLYKS
jgi:uncharacterized protein YbbC (DUF1343 family)